MCHTWIRSCQKSSASTLVKSATLPSATTMIQRLLQRSINIPMIGPSTTIGKKPARLAMASTVAEPVRSVSHQISAKRTKVLPSSEKVCPVQIVKKRACHVDSDALTGFPYSVRALGAKATCDYCGGENVRL